MCDADLWRTKNNIARAEYSASYCIIPDSALPVAIARAITAATDRETDLAMSELFGGFPPSFYYGYRRIRHVDDGYSLCATIYNLYHILNHYNLFGGGYLSQAQSMIDAILRA